MQINIRKKQNNNKCCCPKADCVNHNKCRSCIIKHKETDSLPFCLFPDNGGDKSIENYYKKLKNRFENKENLNMKPKVDDKKCGANESMCTVIKICPVKAISYIEVDEAITDRVVNCKIAPTKNGSNSCGCDCDCEDNPCGGSPYGRIVIDYDKCTGCGICVDECCGTAIYN